MFALINLCTCIIILQCNVIISKVTGISGYILSIVPFILFYLSVEKKKNDLLIAYGYYFLLFYGIISVLLYYINFEQIYPGSIETIISVSMIPLLLLHTKLNHSQYITLLRFIAYSSIPTIFGMFLSKLGYYSDIIVQEGTSTFGIGHNRGTSIYKVSLIYGAIAMIQMISSNYLFYKTRSYSFLFLSLILLYCIFDSGARRLMIPAIFSIFFTFYLTRLNIKLILISISILILGDLFISDISFIYRIFSSFDFIGDEGNVSRILIIKDALNLFISNPLGYGPGSFTTLGKTGSIDYIGYIAESYYLAMLSEYGVIYIFFTFFAMISIINFKKPIFYICIIPVLMEGIFGLSLYIPYYFLCFYLIIYNNE